MSRLTFITCSRADWAKLRPLVRACAEAETDTDLMVGIFGQHRSASQGHTAKEVSADCESMGVKGVGGCSIPPWDTTNMASQFSDTAYWTRGLGAPGTGGHVVVHGDRHEALAAATQAVIGGASLIHVEAGERSGNLDDRFRDAITAMADLAFCAKTSHTLRVERCFRARAYTIGSPEYDEILNNPVNLQDVRDRYELDIEAGGYDVILVHPETGPGSDARNEGLARLLGRYIELSEEAGRKMVIIAPNRDDGWRTIADVYGSRRVIPSMRAQHFYRLLSCCHRFVSNSSMAARWDHGSTLLLGTRQEGRTLAAPLEPWGDGKAGKRFVSAMKVEGVL